MSRVRGHGLTVAHRATVSPFNIQFAECSGDLWRVIFAKDLTILFYASFSFRLIASCCARSCEEF